MGIKEKRERENKKHAWCYSLCFSCSVVIGNNIFWGGFKFSDLVYSIFIFYLEFIKGFVSSFSFFSFLTSVVCFGAFPYLCLFAVQLICSLMALKYTGAKSLFCGDGICLQ